MLSSPENLFSTLDRINLSDGEFKMLVSAIAKASGQDLEIT